MPYVDNAGIRIHYEIDGDGSPLVLQHGFTQSIEDWSECGYVDALRADFRLILIDARGHGLSDKPHDESSYPLDRRVSDVTVVLDILSIEKAHFWGYSMGGWIAYGMAKYAPHRVNSLVIVGQHPFARDQSGFRQLMNDGISGGGDAFVSTFRKMAGSITDGYAARLKSADLKAFLAAASDRVNMEDILESMTMPCCVYSGEADPTLGETKSASERIPKARFFSLPGLSHMGAFMDSNAVLPSVTKFLGGVR
jgi:pimeloyl-ACP methyl ester carboxylesterase